MRPKKEKMTAYAVKLKSGKIDPCTVSENKGYVEKLVGEGEALVNVVILERELVQKYAPMLLE